MESWFEQMSEQFETAAERWGSGIEPWTPAMELPQIDVAEDDEKYIIIASLPGFDKSDVNVYVTDQTLAIDAEEKSELVEEDAEFIQQERSHRAVSRRITLPSDADTESITATMENGILKIRVGRVEPLASGHQIDIE